MSTDQLEHASDHRETRELLPWYLNGTLDGEDLQRVERHLETCTPCKAELGFEKRLARGVRDAEELVFPVDRGWSELSKRGLPDSGVSDDRRPTPRSSVLDRWRAGLARTSVGVRWVLAAQAIAVVVLAALVFNGTEAGGEFRTLSSPPPISAPGDRIRVVFAAGVSEQELREIVLELDGQLIGGPSPFGVYTLAVASGSTEEALATLRTSPRVAFAEPGGESVR